MQWIKKDQKEFHHGGAGMLAKYNNLLDERVKKYPIKTELTKDYSQKIRDDGFVVIKNVIPENVLEFLKEEFDEAVDDGQTKVNDQYYTVISDPLVNCPSILDVITDDHVYDTVCGFFGCIPSIGTLNFRKSYVNKGNPVTTQLFHCDQNSVSFLKCFLYLNDVKDKHDGPLTIVPDSLDKKPSNWTSKYRWTEEEMEELYGEGCLKYLTASAGDLIITRATTSYHRGTPPINQGRTMLTVNFTIHPEEFKPIEFKISELENNKLDDHQKPLTDFLLKVKI